MLAHLSMVFQDRDGDKAQHRVVFEIGASTTFASLSLYAQVIVNTYLNISDAVVSSYSYTISDAVSPLGNPSPTSDVYRRGILLSLAINSELATIEIPAIKASLMDTTGEYAGIRILEQIDEVNVAFALYFGSGYRLMDKTQRELLPVSFTVGGRTS